MHEAIIIREVVYGIFIVKG